MGQATKGETLERTVAILGNMVGRDLKLKVVDKDSSRKYTIDSPEFTNRLCTFGEMAELVYFAITALRMAQNNARTMTVVFVKDEELTVTSTYGFRGHLDLKEAVRQATRAEVFKMTTDEDYDEEEALAFLDEHYEFEAEHVRING